ncbi:uncharacterized protein LOC100833550 [Brachypodium distachyon]|uniref:DUF642 domain-containing protein n=1 Tax=Brachypodium distachyon TaxID=15368 RepID=I1J1T2_BRADI|nr:uncharacterized protein LOC100833550 [Brachypodium distachyon]KQJ84582.1 hypothetical protein BRADI_5g21720v3 [Brachypodium distachyon]|eukprot:XP_003581665.1 uncharacterized protein LOC100833550 [Brachypodium distachyon]
MVISRVALLLLVCAAARPASAGDGLLQNGNFECAPDVSQMNGTRVTSPYAIPSWESTGCVEYIQSGTTQDNGMVLAVPEGAHAVRLGVDSSVRQQLTVTAGAYYSVTFSAARTCAQSEKLSLSVIPCSPDHAPSALPIQTVYSTSGWDSYSWAFLATQDGAVTLVIHHADDGVDDPACGPILDAVAIKTLTVPNPPCQEGGSNMLRNGGFEEGPYMIPGSAACGVLVPPMDEDDVSPLPGWMIMSYSKAVKYIGSDHFAVPSGTRAVELVAGVEAALVQEVDTVPGSACRMEFSVGDAGNGCAACETESAPGLGMRVTAAAAEGSTSVAHCSKGDGGSGWERGVLEFKAVEKRTRVVLFSAGYHTRSDGSGTLCGPVVDDVSLVCAASSAPPPAQRRRLLRR